MEEGPESCLTPPQGYLMAQGSAFRFALGPPSELAAGFKCRSATPRGPAEPEDLWVALLCLSSAPWVVFRTWPAGNLRRSGG